MPTERCSVSEKNEEIADIIIFFFLPYHLVLQTPPTSPRPCEDKMVREEKEDDDISDLLVLLAD
jgi:hypothetical protein